MPTALTNLHQPPPDWFGRNWKWLVPSTILGIALLIGAFFVFLLGLMKSSGAYSGAVARAKTAPAVVAALGSPISARFWLLGSVEVNGSSGRANLTIPLAGPKGSATVYERATKTEGQWHYDRLIVQIENTGEEIDLSETAAPAS